MLLFFSSSRSKRGTGCWWFGLEKAKWRRDDVLSCVENLHMSNCVSLYLSGVCTPGAMNGVRGGEQEENFSSYFTSCSFSRSLFLSRSLFFLFFSSSHSSWSVVLANWGRKEKMSILIGWSIDLILFCLSSLLVSIVKILLSFTSPQ